MIDWLFEINSLKLSTKDTVYLSNTYTGSVIPDSFSGVSLRWDISGNSLIAPNDLSFDVSNTTGSFSENDFEGNFCSVRLISDGTQIRVWKFKIKRAISYYGKITCYCVDFLQDYLKGDYPNTPSPKEVWSSGDDSDSEDDYCIPVVLGVAYIPVQSVNTGSDRYYVLGESGPTYTVYEVTSPRAWPNQSTWPSGSYTMSGSVSSGYQLLQAIIADSNGDTIADSNGLWRSGNVFYNMLCRYDRSDTVSLTNPAEWVQYVLEAWGVASGDINSTVFSTTAALYNTYTIGFDGGGWWQKESREGILSNLLQHTDSFITCTDKVELYQFDKTPKETITNVLKLSFSPTTVTKSETDSGRVHWPESYTKPSDELLGQTIVPTHNSGSEDSPSSTILSCKFFPGESVNAQKAGILYFQKKYEQKHKVTFSTTLLSLTNYSTLSPGHVITINNLFYGGTNNLIITEMTINHDLKVDITGVILNYLEDWGDLTTSPKSIITDSSVGFQIATTDYNGDLNASWNYLLDIPDRFLETATLGLNATDSYFGYYDGSSFKTYMDANGNLQCGNPSTGEGIVWNQGTAKLTISGDLVVKNPSSVRTDLNVENGATNGANWATNLSNIPSFGSLAYKSTITDPDVTSISGGKILTSTIIGTASGGYWDLNASAMWLPYVTPGVASFIAFGGASEPYGGRIFGIGGSIGLSAYTGSQVSMSVGINYLRYKTSSNLDITGTGTGYTLSPDHNYTDATYRTCLGTYNVRYWWVYSGAFSAANPTYYYDSVDDLALLHAIRPGDDGRVLKSSLPNQITDRLAIKKKLQEDNFGMLTEEDIDELLDDESDMGAYVGVNLAEGLFLVEGAVRQLDRENSATQYEILDWINNLEKRIKIMEDSYGKSN